MFRFFRLILTFIVSIVLPLSIIAALVYLVFTRKPIIEEKSHEELIKSELSIIYNRLEYLNKYIKVKLKKDSSKINLQNCKGILQDENNDSFFDKTQYFDKEILAMEINKYRKEKENVHLVVYYNLCSVNYSDNKHFELIGTSKYILDNELKKSNGKSFFRAQILKSDINKITPIIKEVYAPLDIIIDNQ